MQILTARRLLTDIGSVEYPVLRLADDGRIAEIESDPSLTGADTLTAGFFDVHTHGAAGHDVMDESPDALPRIARFLASRGVTHFLPTTVTAPLDATLRALDRLAHAIETADRSPADRSPAPAEAREPPSQLSAQPLGIHLEGPFVSHGKRGVHPPAHILAPSIPVFDQLWAAARGHIRVMTLAPEEPGAMDLIAHAAALGVRVSIGHSIATAAVAREAIARGAVSATHTFNAMRPLDHREPGILGVVLDDPTLFAELICDGVHVADEAVRLWFRAKAPDHAILVTDSMAATGMPDGDYTLGGLPVTVVGPVCLSGGVLAGSVLTLEQAVANLQQIAHTDLATATRAATANPAHMAGFADTLALRVGNLANLNRFDAHGRRTATYVRGHRIAAVP